jgi:hypothetical protein
MGMLEVTNTNCIVFGLTPMIYRIWGKYTDAVVMYGKGKNGNDQVKGKYS